MSLVRGLAEDPSLRCTLLVNHAASRSVREELRLDIERLAQGRCDNLRSITTEFLGKLKAEGIARERSLLARLSVIVADLGDRSEGEGAALVLLSGVVDRAGIANAWTALREDGMRLAETAGRRDVSALWNLLEAHGIRAVDGSGPLLLQREDHVPPYPHPFVGREAVIGEISTLLSAAGGGSRPVVAVRGLPGSGKTAVAAAVADELRTAFPGGVLWASIGPNPNLLSVLAGWGRTLGVKDLAGYPNVGAALARMKVLLRDRKTLLVLDDVWEAEHARSLAVGGPESATLATTRSRGAARRMAPGGTVLALDPLIEAEAVSLLAELATSLGENDRGRLAELAARLGRLPLALGVAGRLLEEEATLGLGVDDLLAELEEGKTLLEAAVPSDLSDLVEATTPTVAALLGRSTDRLGVAERERFARLGTFESGPASFDLPAAGAVWGDVGKQGARATLGALVGRGLVDPDGSGRFSLHPVLSMQARSLLRRSPDDGRGARLLHATHYLGVLRSAQALYHGGGEPRKVGLELLDAEWENMRAGQLWAAARLAEAREDTEAARLVSSYADEGWQLLSMRATIEDQARWLEDALEADRVLTEASLLEEGPQEDSEEAQRTHRSARARHLHILAQARRQARQTGEAFALEREASEIYRSLMDRRGESRTLNGLGVLHTARGEYELAERSYLSAVELLDAEAADAGSDTRSRGSRDVDRAAVLGNLGPLYKNMGRAQPAGEAIRQAIAIFRTLGDMFQVGIALNNLGALRSELEGDGTGARRAFASARRIFRGLGSHGAEAVSLLALGREHANAGEHQRAERRAREVIAVCRALGDRHLEVWALAVLGDARLGLGYPAEAEGIYREELDAARGAQDKRLEAMALRGLGRVALDDKNPNRDPKKALAHFEEAVAVVRSAPVPSMQGSLLFDAAMAYYALGERGIAVKKAEEALQELEDLKAPKAEKVRTQLLEWGRNAEGRAP
ncbi:MAG: NB-ARC domain-containing protein [Actinomycetota bacterium]|nr:NB-ARC domain-containing protein [Actinomycetota bacterium]